MSSFYMAAEKWTTPFVKIRNEGGEKFSALLIVHNFFAVSFDVLKQKSKKVKGFFFDCIAILNFVVLMLRVTGKRSNPRRK